MTAVASRRSGLLMKRTLLTRSASGAAAVRSIMSAYRNHSNAMPRKPAAKFALELKAMPPIKAAMAMLHHGNRSSKKNAKTAMSISWIRNFILKPG
jgi:hypothetical protein